MENPATAAEASSLIDVLDGSVKTGVDTVTNNRDAVPIRTAPNRSALGSIDRGCPPGGAGVIQGTAGDAGAMSLNIDRYNGSHRSLSSLYMGSGEALKLLPTTTFRSRACSK